MDWTGIKRAERIMQILLILCAIGSVSYAFINDWFPYTTFGMIGGFGLASLISVPNWPWFNRNPVGWHKAIDPEKEKEYFEKKQKKKDKKSGKKDRSSESSSPKDNKKQKNKPKKKKKDK